MRGELQEASEKVLRTALEKTVEEFEAKIAVFQ